MEGVQGYPFGSYVDYILDENGCPVMLLSDQSMHTANIKHNPSVSMFCQLPRQVNNQASAALSRVTVMGHVSTVPDEELSALQLAFTIIHPYAEQIIDSPKFKLFRLQPEKIYFSGGFGVMATWVNVEDYQNARADVLAAEVPSVLSRVNLDKQGELLLVCKHFLGLNDVESVRVQAVDRLGIDLRVKTGELQFLSVKCMGPRAYANTCTLARGAP
jgi:putative heme iron utilization protein